MTNQTETSKVPTHVVYYVKESADKEFWQKVGVGWAHGDKEGLNIILNVLGQDVTLTIRPNKAKPS